MSREYDEAVALLERILPEHKKISEAPPWKTDDAELYKAVTQDGSIWLVQNPASWGETLNEQGHAVKFRRKPILKFTLAEAKKTMRPTLEAREQTKRGPVNWGGPYSQKPEGF